MTQSLWRNGEIPDPHPESRSENVEQSNLPVQDYQLQLMLLEQQKKKRAMMLAQESYTARPGFIQTSDTTPKHLNHHIQTQRPKPKPELKMSIKYAEIWDFSPAILLVETDKTCSRIACKFLSSAYCSVKCAEVDEESIDKLFTDHGQYDLIFLDVDSHFLAEIARIAYLMRTLDPHVPIVAMNSEWSKEPVNGLFQHGVIDVLDKPFTKESMIEMVKKHCQHLLKEPNHQTEPHQTTQPVDRGQGNLLDLPPILAS